MNEPAMQAKKDSPIEKAMTQLKNNVGTVQETMTRFETTLASVLTNPEKPKDATESETKVAQTSLETQLNSMADEILGIDAYL